MGRTPAKAGVQLRCAIDGAATSPNWTPAFAGVRWWLGNSDLSSATRTPRRRGSRATNGVACSSGSPPARGYRYAAQRALPSVICASAFAQIRRRNGVAYAESPYNPDAKLSSSSFALAGTSSAALLKVRLPLGPMARVCGLIVQL